ncbi:hypothetical protein Tco_0120080 [Tanacetum coccineum]
MTAGNPWDIIKRANDTSSRSGNDAHADDADIRPIYDEEPMDEVDQNAEQCHDTRPLLAELTDNMTTELSNQLLESENSVKFYGLSPASRRYRSFVLVSYPV